MKNNTFPWNISLLQNEKCSNLCYTDALFGKDFVKVKDSESAAFSMPTNLENSAVATGLEKVSFHSNP